MKPGLYVATIDDRPGRVAYWNGSRYLDVESGLYFDNDLGVTDVHPRLRAAVNAGVIKVVGQTASALKSTHAHKLNVYQGVGS